MSAVKRLSRRAILRGTVAGAGVTVALPFLDCVLNGNGNALASGAPLPVRFGTWFWGLGTTPGHWTPQKEGADYEITTELMPIKPYKEYVSILSGYDVVADGKPNFPHATGGTTFKTGTAPSQTTEFPGASFDVTISDRISAQSRFRSLDVACIHGQFILLSGRGTGKLNPFETSPAAVYARVFGPDFVDPNNSEFKPDPLIMARRSVLSSVSDQRQSLERQVGAADRARLDEYFTSLRQMENQLSLRLEKPAPKEACKAQAEVAKIELGTDIELVRENHALMSELISMTIACDQTRVFNLAFNNPTSSLTRRGSSNGHHDITHEEPIDPKIGYQPAATAFVRDIMAEWGVFVGKLAQTKEGAGSLLDNMFLLAHSETNFARQHSIANLPIMVAGRAGGRLKSGVHIVGRGQPATSVGLTAMQVMGVPVDRFGTGSMETRKIVTEILV